MKRIVWILLIVFFLLFSLAPAEYELSQQDKIPSRSFELVHNYYTDYNFYLSRIREGMEGRWIVVERYTSEPHNGSLIQIFYLLIGKTVAGFFDTYVGATVGYHGARIILGGILLAITALFIIPLFPSLIFQILALLLAVTASGWPVFVDLGGTLRLGGYMSWWTIMDNLQRITFLPHLLFGQIGIILLLMYGGNLSILKKPRNWIVLGILSCILGLVFPPGLIFVGTAYIVLIVLDASYSWKEIVNKKTRREWIADHMVGRMCIGILSLPSLLYFQLMFRMNPWKRLIELDVIHPLPFNYLEYAKALGPMLPLGILGLILVFWKKEKKFMVVAAWALSWLLLLVVFRFIPSQSPLRFSEMAPQIPLGVLTAYLFYQIWLAGALGSYKKFFSGFNSLTKSIFSLHNELSRSQEKPKKFFTLTTLPSSIIKIFSLFVPIFLIALGIGMMLSSYFWQKDFIDQKVRAGWPFIPMNNYIVYPMDTFTQAFRYLENQTPKDSIILSDLTAGNYIPAYTGRTVYVGHDNTVEAEKKIEKMRKFFRGEMKGDEAETFLTDERIDYVFFGFQERENGKLENLEKTYPFLTDVYNNRDITIYQSP